MLTAGIDLGSKNTKVVILKDDKEILAQSCCPQRVRSERVRRAGT